MTGLDVVYPVRRGDDNEELRYSLRSLRHLPHGDVWFVGHLPSWAAGPGIVHMHTEQRLGDEHKRDNVWSAMRALADGGPEEFVLMNDDFFVTQQMTAPPPRLHRGPLADHAADREARVPGSGYARCLRATERVFRRLGMREDVLSYELHTPMRMTRTDLALALDLTERYADGAQVAPRSLVGNLSTDRGVHEPNDVKVYAGETLPTRYPFVSTMDTSFKYHPAGAVLRAMFTEPSPYER